MIPKNQVEAFFRRYEWLYNGGIRGVADMDDVAKSYSDGFVAATPEGVAVGENGQKLKQVMEQGFEVYKKLGTKSMTCDGVDVTDIDPTHCLATVQWSGVYARDDGHDVTIPFEVSYLVEACGDDLKIFAWIAGDEEAELKKHGII